MSQQDALMRERKIKNMGSREKRDLIKSHDADSL